MQSLQNLAWYGTLNHPRLCHSTTGCEWSVHLPFTIGWFRFVKNLEMILQFPQRELIYCAKDTHVPLYFPWAGRLQTLFLDEGVSSVSAISKVAFKPEVIPLKPWMKAKPSHRIILRFRQLKYGAMKLRCNGASNWIRIGKWILRWGSGQTALAEIFGFIELLKHLQPMAVKVVKAKTIRSIKWNLDCWYHIIV